MAKMKYKKAEGGGDFLVAKGVFSARIQNVKCQDSKNGDPQWVVTYEITKGEHKGKIVNDYLTWGRGQWRVDEVLSAIGLQPKEGASIDTDILAAKAKGKILLLETKVEEYNGQDRGRVHRALPNKAAKMDPKLEDDPDLNDEPNEDDIDEDDADGEDEPDDELDDDDDDDDDEEDDDDEDEIDLDDMSRVELKRYIRENELDVRVTKKMSNFAIVDAIREAIGDGDEDEPEDDEPDTDEARAEYKKLQLPELKDELRERGLPTTGKKADLIERLIDDDLAEDPFADDDDEDED